MPILLPSTQSKHVQPHERTEFHYPEPAPTYLRRPCARPFGAAAHLAKRKLDRTCPRVPLAALPKPSACRNVIERTCETAAAPAWGLEKSVMVSSWSGGDDNAHWTPSFAALQVEVPFSVLAAYGPLYGKDDNKHTGTEGDAFCLFHGRPRNGARGVGLG